MRAHFAIGAFVASLCSASHAQQELMDEKTHELTNRGAIVSLVASAQVAEMRCGLKGQITKALGLANTMNMHLDLNDKNDYSDVLFFASEILGSGKKAGWDKWCRNYRDGSGHLFEGR